MEKECTCKNCKNHCECELHNIYEHQENGCDKGKCPISHCEMKKEKD